MGELLAVEGIFDDVTPGLRDALGSAEGPGRHAREDLHQGVIGEVAGHRAPLGAVHAAAARRWGVRRSQLRSLAMSADGDGRR